MNEGQRDLRRVATRTPEREIAKRCRVDQSNVSRWLNGVSRPVFASRVHAEIAFGIDLHAWDRDVAADAVGSSLGASGAELQRRAG